MDVLKEGKGWQFIELSEKELSNACLGSTGVLGVRFVHKKCFKSLEKEPALRQTYSIYDLAVESSLNWNLAYNREFLCHSCGSPAPRWVEQMYELLRL